MSRQNTQPRELALTIPTNQGFDLSLKITGYQQKPMIEILAPESFQGMKIIGREWITTPKDLPEVSLEASERLRFLAGSKITEIVAAIDTLPAKISGEDKN